MAEKQDTNEKIMTAFLKLAAERGIEATTTRALAEAANVNEVTIFRNFKDKTNLVREMFRHFDPAQKIKAYPLEIDISSPQHAQVGLVNCANFIYLSLQEHPELLQFGLGEYWRFPELKEDFAAAPKATLDLLQRALIQTRPLLRANIDVEVTAMSLQGLILMLVLWQGRGWAAANPTMGQHFLEVSIRPLFE